MLIGHWYLDEFGNRTREIKALDAEKGKSACVLRADAIHSRNNSESDTRGDQAVFDGGRAAGLWN